MDVGRWLIVGYGRNSVKRSRAGVWCLLSDAKSEDKVSGEM